MAFSQCSGGGRSSARRTTSVRAWGCDSDRSLKLDQETVLYRHERTFVNQTALAVNVNDTDQSASVDTAIEAVREYALERVGEVLRIDMVAVSQKGSDGDAFAALAGRAWRETSRPLVLRSGIRGRSKRPPRRFGSHSVLAAADPETADGLAGRQGRSARPRRHCPRPDQLGAG